MAPWTKSSVKSSTLAKPKLGKNCSCRFQEENNHLQVRRQALAGHTGIFIYMNKGLVDTYSKKQNTVKTSTFGSELVASRVVMERAKALRIKLQLMGIPLEGPTRVHCDNESVCKSTINVDSRLNKKHQVICWHAMREACAGGWIELERSRWRQTQQTF